MCTIRASLIHQNLKSMNMIIPLRKRQSIKTIFMNNITIRSSIRPVSLHDEQKSSIIFKLLTSKKYQHSFLPLVVLA